MAENAETKVEETVVEEVKEEVKDEPKEVKDEQPSIQDLMTRIAKLEREKNKASAEAADFKKKWRDSLSETEKASQEKAEEEAKKAEEFESIKRENAIYRMTESYLEEGFTADLAKQAATAEVDGDRDLVHAIRKQVSEEREKKIKEDTQKEFFAKYQLNAGQGSADNSISKEQFNAMSLIERSKLKRENEAEYNRLIAL